MNCFYEILSCLPTELQDILSLIDSNAVKKLTEIRIRRNKSLCVVAKNTTYFVNAEGALSSYLTSDTVIVNETLFENSFFSLCDYSLYNNMEDIVKGYITLKSGARVGVTGTGIKQNNSVVSVKDVSSLNIRIPNQVKNCSLQLLNFLYVNSFPSIVIAGMPNSGKTTLIRDMVRNLAGGFNDKYRKICIIDERNEICGKYNNNFCMDIGETTDVITAYPKDKGIELATRTMSPDMIVCDEISTLDEVKSITYGFSAGIKFVLSVHCENLTDLTNKQIVRELLKTNEFSYFVLLNEHTYNYEIIDSAEVYYEVSGNFGSDNIINGFGNRTLY